MNIVHCIGVKSSGEQAASAFTTLEGLKSWWTTYVSGDPLPGGRLTFKFPNTGPVFDVIQSDGSGVHWKCVDGPQEWIGTDIIVRLEETDTEILVLFTHSGWRAETLVMHHCSTQWAYFLIGLKRKLEGKSGTPFGGAYEQISTLSPSVAAVPAKDTDEPQALVRALYDNLMARGDVAFADGLLSSAYIDHDIPGRSGDGGREDLKQTVLAVREAFPDIRPILSHVFASNDLVCVRVEASGTHTGTKFMGIAPTNKRMTWREVHVFRCADGQIHEHWGVFDLFSIMQQLGIRD